MSIKIEKEFNPILESKEIDYTIFKSNMPKTTPGTAIVLSKENGYLGDDSIKLVKSSVKHGDLRFGGYKFFYRIDTSAQSIIFRCELPARNLQNAFHCVISFHISIIDPIYVIQKRIDKVAERICDDLNNELMYTSQKIDILEYDVVNILRNDITHMLYKFKVDWLLIEATSVHEISVTSASKKKIDDYKAMEAIKTNDPFNIAMNDESELLGRGNKIKEKMRDEQLKDINHVSEIVKNKIALIEEMAITSTITAGEAIKMKRDIMEKSGLALPESSDLEQKKLTEESKKIEFEDEDLL